MSDKGPTPDAVAIGRAYKDLCIDAVDARAAGRFWAAVLGLRSRTGGGNVLLTTESSGARDLDQHRARAEDGEAAGAPGRNTGSIADLSRPEPRSSTRPSPGPISPIPRVASCAVSSGHRRSCRPTGCTSSCVDSVEPQRIAAWWAQACLDAELGADRGRVLASVGPGAGLPWEMVFGAVPEPKTVKNRIHWDVWGTPRRCWPPVRPCSRGAATTRSAGTCWPTRRATSSACSAGTDPPRLPPGPPGPLSDCELRTPARRCRNPTVSDRVVRATLSPLGGPVSWTEESDPCPSDRPDAVAPFR